MRLTFLGTGTQVVTARRGHSGILLEGGGEKVLLDCGSGTLDRLARLEVAANQLDRVCVTHFHPDHTIDLTTILFAHRHPSMSRHAPLVIYGPPGLTALRDRICQAWPAVGLPGLAEWIELSSGTHPVGPFKVTAGPTRHAPESLGYRFELDGRSVVYTGDTGYDAAVASLAREVDLLVTECSHPDGEGVEGHLTPSVAGRLAAEARCQELILTHLYPSCDALEDVLAYDGPIRIAEDGLTFDLD